MNPPSFQVILAGLFVACAAPIGIVCAELPAASSEAVSLAPGATFQLGTRAATLKSVDTLPYVESKYTRRFRFDSFDNPKLKELRERYALPEVIGQGEFDQQVLLMDWTHRRFPKFGHPSAKSRGALEILQAIDDGHTYFCAQYAQVLVSAATSLGWVSRPLALRRHRGAAKVGGSTEHSVTDATDPYFPIGQDALDLRAEGKPSKSRSGRWRQTSSATKRASMAAHGRARPSPSSGRSTPA